jgi:hypothetical protein
MLVALKIAAVTLVAVAMALALAHALEWPGKRRLSKEEYLTVQPIYYPGFTFGGASEPLAILVVIVLLTVTPAGTAVFWLTAAALAALIAMHAAYWLLTHPVNNFWLKGFKLKGASARFFSLGTSRRNGVEPSWKRLRDRWEYSHILRAGLGLASLVLLAAAIAI